MTFYMSQNWEKKASKREDEEGKFSIKRRCRARDKSDLLCFHRTLELSFIFVV